MLLYQKIKIKKKELHASTVTPTLISHSRTDQTFSPPLSIILKKMPKFSSGRKVWRNHDARYLYKESIKTVIIQLRMYIKKDNDGRTDQLSIKIPISDWSSEAQKG